MRSQKELINKKEWDVLIILDACRLDTLAEVINKYMPKKVEVEPVISEGSCTPEWFLNTFTEKDNYSDIIYVSGNAWIATAHVRAFINRHDKQGVVYSAQEYAQFYKLINVWDFGWKNIGGVYTTDPQEIVNTTIKHMIVYRKKKFILHFLQPHGPYPFFPDLAKYYRNSPWTPDAPLWNAVKSGKVSLDVVKIGYRSTLTFVLNYIKQLLSKPIMHGKKVVITSDHGECLGEDGIFFHPCKTNHPILRTVPWAEIQL